VLGHTWDKIEGCCAASKFCGWYFKAMKHSNFMEKLSAREI